MTSFHHILQRVPPPCYGRTFCTQCSWSNMQKKNSKLHRYQQGSELKRTKKTTTTTIVFLSQLDFYLTREKPPFCHLHIVSKQLNVWEKLPFFCTSFPGFLNYHVHLSYHQSVPSYLKRRQSRYLAKPTTLTKLFQMILSTKSHFDKTLTVLFKCGYCI